MFRRIRRHAVAIQRRDVGFGLAGQSFRIFAGVERFRLFRNRRLVRFAGLFSSFFRAGDRRLDRFFFGCGCVVKSGLLGDTVRRSTERVLSPASQVRFEVVGADKVFDVQEGGTLEPDVDERGLQAR
jgi:hypothetical protein